MRFAFIDVEKACWPGVRLCSALKVSPSGHYAWRARVDSVHEEADRQLGLRVREAQQRSRGIYGGPWVHAEFRAQGVRISRKRVARLMREQKLKGRTRRAWVRTTDSTHGIKTAENQLNREFTALKHNERWVVTYLRTPEGFLCLAVVLDLYSRMVVGWALSAMNDRRLTLQALEQAVRTRRPDAGPWILMARKSRGVALATVVFSVWVVLPVVSAWSGVQDYRTGEAAKWRRGSGIFNHSDLDRELRVYGFSAVSCFPAPGPGLLMEGPN